MMQLVLKPGSITVNMAVFEGVLTTKTFEGSDCYGQLIRFLSEQLGTDNPVQATITVSRQTKHIS
jgi:hypothetical protein